MQNKTSHCTPKSTRFLNRATMIQETRKTQTPLENMRLAINNIQKLIMYTGSRYF